MSFLFFLSVSVVSLFSKAKFMEPRARPRLSLFARRHRVSQEDMREDCGIEKQETEKNNLFRNSFVSTLLRNTL
jgi:hypothetical protein